MDEVRVEGLAATPWRQVLKIERDGQLIRFYQSVDFPEFYKGVRFRGDGTTQTRYACDDQVVYGLGAIARKMNEANAVKLDIQET